MICSAADGVGAVQHAPVKKCRIYIEDLSLRPNQEDFLQPSERVCTRDRGSISSMCVGYGERCNPRTGLRVAEGLGEAQHGGVGGEGVHELELSARGVRQPQQRAVRSAVAHPHAPTRQPIMRDSAIMMQCTTRVA